MKNIHNILRQNPLFFAFFFPAVVDGTVTLLGQSSEYWQPNRVVNEASPAFYFLVISPWLFLLGSVLWFVIWYWLFKKLPEKITLFLTLLFIAGHSWGSGSWIAKFFRDQGLFTTENTVLTNLSWGILVLYFGLVALTATYCLQIYIKKFRLKSSIKID